MKKTFDSRTETFDAQLATAVETNCGEWLRLKGRLPWVELHEDEDALWIFAGDTYPGNSVALANFTSANVRRRLGEILDRHLKHKAACNWIVGASSRPTDLSRHLKEHGFSCRIHYAGMACDLGALGTPPSVPAGVAVVLEEAPSSLRPLTTPRRRRRLEGRILMAQLRPRVVWSFSAKIEGVPVGETTLLAAKGTAGIYDVEVMEKFRGRGIGTALIDAALRQARQLGYPVAVLGATGMGSRVYTRLGFREVGKLSFWKHGKMRQMH